MQDDPLIQTVFGGRWTIDRPLTSGGMGTVYIARHVDTGREVALKIIKSESAGNANFVERFRKETAALAAVSHPNVVTFLDSGVEGGNFFLVMELLAGRSLRDEMQAPLPWQRAVRIAADVCRALAAVHNSGVVHRDLKPENIFLQRSEGHDDFAKLIDFGIVRAPDASGASPTQTGAIVGTPGYISPEQLHGAPATPASDVYAVGVVLYEMVTGQFPFRAPNMQATFVRQLIDPVPPPRSLVAALPDDVDAAITRLMERDPARRVATAAEALSLLKGLLSPPAPSSTPSTGVVDFVTETALAPPSVAPPSSVAPASSVAALPRSANRARVVIGVVVVVVVAAVFAGWWVQRPTPSEQLRAVVAAPAQTVGCVPLRVTGETPREVGVAVAATVCRALGLSQLAPARFRGPAALLRLPTRGTPNLLEDPFSGDEATAALAAAAARTDAVVEGDVGVNDEGVTITLRARRQGGDELVVRRAGANLVAVGTAAANALIDAIAAPPPVVPPSDRSPILGDDPARIFRLKTAVEVGEDGACDALAALAPLHAATLAKTCGQKEPDGPMPVWPEAAAAALDAASPRDQAWFRLQWLPAASPEAWGFFAATVHDKAGATGPLVVGALERVEAMAWERAGDFDAARAAFDAAVDADPSSCNVRELSSSFEIDPTLGARAATFWCPTAPGMWSWRASLTDDAQAALPMMRLAYLLQDRAPRGALGLGRVLARLGDWGEVRALASFHQNRAAAFDSWATAYLLATVDGGTGHIRVARDRLEKSVFANEEWNDDLLAHLALALRFERLINGGQRPDIAARNGVFADRFAAKYLLGGDNVRPGSAALPIVGVLSQASPELAREALPRVRALLADGTLIGSNEATAVLAAEQSLLDGDVAAAREAVRGLVGVGWVPRAAFAGDDALAEEHLRALAKSGAPSADTAALALLLEKRGDHERAKALAGEFVAAFSKSDVDIPALAAMRALAR